MQSPQVFVRSGAKTAQVEIDPTIHSCLDLKKKIYETQVLNKDQPLDPSQQILSFSGSILEDGRKLADYNIQHGSTVHLLTKPLAKDILRFDECKSCHYQAVDPVVLPCGHSCCRTCIAVGATACPAPGCQSLLKTPREDLPSNWIATQFFDEKPPKITKQIMCQVCEFNGAQTEATQWCESCAKASEIHYYCNDCCTAEHTSVSLRKHVRGPIEKKPSLSLSTCSKHNATNDIFCLEENVLICHRCRDTDHKTHKTQLFVDCEKFLKDGFKTSVDRLTALKAGKEQRIKQLIQKKHEEVDKLEAQIKSIKIEMEGLEGQLKDQNTEKALLTSLVFKTLIDEIPLQDLLFDAKKIEIIKQRIQLLFTQDQIFPSAILDGKPELVDLLLGMFPVFLAQPELLYSKVDHGGWTDFSQQCGGRYDTLMLIQVGEHVFGGFTHLCWGRIGDYVPNNPRAFLFSLSNPTNRHVGEQFLQNCVTQPDDDDDWNQDDDRGYGDKDYYGDRSIYTGHESVAFGGGHDIAIGSGTGCYTNFGISYRPPAGFYYGTPEASTFFCGSRDFVPTNVEIFALHL